MRLALAGAQAAESDGSEQALLDQLGDLPLGEVLGKLNPVPVPGCCRRCPMGQQPEEVNRLPVVSRGRVSRLPASEHFPKQPPSLTTPLTSGPAPG